MKQMHTRSPGPHVKAIMLALSVVFYFSWAPSVLAFQESSQSAGPVGVAEVSKNDSEMNAAKQKARRTVATFRERMKNPATGEQGFSVKVGIGPGGDELIWVNDLKLVKETGWRGRLANDPIAAGYTFGQIIDFESKDIVDWGYFKGPIMQGHFTTRVLLNRMKPADAAAIRQVFGW